MASIVRQKVRARIIFGNITVETPDVLSFSVRQARGQSSATFSASVKVDHDEIVAGTEVVASSITIEAGLYNNLNKIFTGKIYKCVINPVRTDASKLVLNLAGKDILSELEGQKVNRRLKTYRDGDNPPERYGIITNVTKHSTPTKQKFPTKVYTSRPITAVDLETRRLEVTPDAFKNENKPARDGRIKTLGGISVNATPTAEATE